MKKEVKSAVDFLTNILRSRNVDRVQTHFFNTKLQNLLYSRYEDHWFPDKPCKGSGYRCIRFNHSLDPIVREAGLSCGIEETTMKSFFPRELTMWVDPHEVSYRIGENGSVGVLFSSENDTDQENTSQSQDTSTGETSDLNNSYNLTCKEQFLSALPGLSISGVNLNKLATLVSS
ncbi:hypothetical protein CHS0354_029654 [Potamilus streckersoni]|uniref:Anti-proliferative protein domain-containing protein n=1 Tax=Potamilus streckersoni TaxID=2493646 RepID=A0AAE0VIC3_9BIVA|nr:hypothetical protein CHS0354_029654 [Potamilus streckersoni]